MLSIIRSTDSRLFSTLSMWREASFKLVLIAVNLTFHVTGITNFATVQNANNESLKEEIKKNKCHRNGSLCVVYQTNRISARIIQCTNFTSLHPPPSAFLFIFFVKKDAITAARTYFFSLLVCF